MNWPAVRVVKRIALDAVADRKGSFLNDIAVDEVRRVAYLSDSGLRSAPNNLAGIILADFATGSSRRVLHRHPAVLAEPGAKVISHGAEVWPGNPLVLGNQRHRAVARCPHALLDGHHGHAGLLDHHRAAAQCRSG